MEVKLAPPTVCDHPRHPGPLVAITHWPLGKYGSNFKNIIFKLTIQNNSLGTWCEIALKYMARESRPQ